MSEPENHYCYWTEDGDMWEASCGVCFYTDTDYAPPHEYMKYCYQCGKQIKFYKPIDFRYGDDDE